MDSTDINQTEANAEKPVVAILCPERNYLLPYFSRSLSGWKIDNDFYGAIFENRPMDYALMISDVSVYNRSEGIGITEEEPVDSLSNLYKTEQDFIRQCSSAGKDWCVLRVDNVVATGMAGLPRKLVNGIYRGNYFRIKGNTAEISAVHGVDVAAVGALCCSKKISGVFNCVSPWAYTLDNFADSLAWRMKQKKIFPLAAKWCKLIYSKGYYKQLTSTLTFSAEKLCGATGFNGWHNVCDYLTTHIYDDESL